MPPQTNATVTRVDDAGAARGDRDDFDAPGVEPAGAAGVKWTGAVACYYRENVQRTATGDSVDVLVTRTIIVDTSDFDADLNLDTDDVVTLTGPDGATITGQAVAVARSSLAGIPGELQTTRIELEPTVAGER